MRVGTGVRARLQGPRMTATSTTIELLTNMDFLRGPERPPFFSLSTLTFNTVSSPDG